MPARAGKMSAFCSRIPPGSRNGLSQTKTGSTTPTIGFPTAQIK